jgi:hypothetical protein
MDFSDFRQADVNAINFGFFSNLLRRYGW